MFGFTVEVRDKTLARLGQIRPEDLTLAAADRFNNVGEWSLILPTAHPMVSALRTPGGGIIVTRHSGDVLFSGPVTAPESTASKDSPAGTVTVTGVTDSVILADRLALPQPSNTDPTSQTLSHDERTGTVEALMHAYVNANIGPGAPLARRDLRLTMGVNLGRGATTTKRARFVQLGSLLAELAAGADLGFRVVQVGSALQFQTYAITDRSAEVRLDIYNGTLASHKVITAPPGATRVIVGGPGEGEDRAFAEATTPDSLAAESAWSRRIEVFLDKRAEDPAELLQAGLEKLAETGFATVAVQAVPADDSAWEFGTDWHLGDRVTTVVEGVELSSVVTGYSLKAGASGIRLGAVLGDPDGFKSDAAGRLSGVERRVSNLETNEATAAGSITLAHLAPATKAAVSTTGYRDECADLTDWEWGGSGTVIVANTSNADVGGNVFRAVGSITSLTHRVNIPYDPTSTYRIRVRMRQTVSGSVANTNGVYIGFTGVAADGVTLVNAVGSDSAGNQHYVAANGGQLASGTAWTEYVGHVRGWNATNGSNTPRPHPTDPGVMHVNTHYVRPTIWVNYTNGNGTAEIDLIEVAVIPAHAPDRITVVNQSVGSVPNSAHQTIIVTIPNGRSMGDTNYHVSVVAKEDQSDIGSATFTTHDAFAWTATSFKVRLAHNWSGPLNARISYTLTKATP